MSANDYWLSRVRPVQGLEYSRLGDVARGPVYGHHGSLWRLFDRSARTPDGRAYFLFRYEPNEGVPVFYMLSSVVPCDKKGIWRIESKPYKPDIRNGDPLAFKLRVNPVLSRRTKGKKNTTHHDVAMDAQKRFLEELAQLARVDGAGKKSAIVQRLLAGWAVSGPMGLKERITGAIKANERFKSIALAKMPDRILLATAMKAVSDKALELWFTRTGEHNGFSLILGPAGEAVDFRVLSYQSNVLREKRPPAEYSSVDIEGSLEVTDAANFKDVLVRGIGKAKGFGCGLMLVRRI